MSYTLNTPITKSNWTRQISIPQLPTASGTLTSVSFTLESSIEGTLKVESVDSAPSVVTSTLSAQMTLKRPDGSVLLTHAPEDTKTDSFSVFDGIVDYEGDSGKTYDISSEGSGIATIDTLSESDIALFTGFGTVMLPLSAEGVSGFDGSGNLQSEATLFASSKTVVTYTYETPDLTVSVQPQSQFTVGSQNALLLTVQNRGNGPTNGTTTVYTTIPFGLSLISAGGSNWTCGIAGRSITCTHTNTISSAERAEPISIAIMVDSNSLPSINATATVHTQGDINEKQGANAASTTIPVTAIEVTNGNNVNNNGGNGNGRSGQGGIAPGGFGGGAADGIAPGGFGGGDIEGDILIDAQGCEIPPSLIDPIFIKDINSCFEFVSDRAIEFNDIDDHSAKRYIEILKKTKIRAAGDFIVSGHGNHSSGKQQEHFQSGNFPFQPNRSATRLEVVKVALIANCLSIDSDTSATTHTFTDISKAITGDEAQDFIPQIFYTAARHGIAMGYPDGSAKPLEKANNAEILALLLRASGAMPKGFVMPNTSSWYAPYLEFAHANHLVQTSFDPNGSMDRGDLSKLLIHIMALDPDPAISAYIAQINTKNQFFHPQELFYTPLPQLGNLEPISTASCDERAPRINTCLRYNSNQSKYQDVSASHNFSDQIDLLKGTSLRSTGNSILENSSSFWPERKATRLDIVRTTISANCIPIFSSIPRASIPFDDLAQADTNDPILDLATRIFSTAAHYNIVTGDDQNNARPSDPATLLETLVILLRSSNALPEGYEGEEFNIDNLPSGDQWYDSYISFALAQGLLDEAEGTSLFLPITRARLTKLLADTMQFSRDISVRSYRTSVDGLIR